MFAKRILLLLGLAVLLIQGCRKDGLFTNDPNAQLDFSRDTVLFDTVFTQSPASVTKRFVARNPANRAVRVNIALAGGTPSPYRINVDGTSGTSFQNVEILGGDSVFVFVEVTIDQNNVNNPLIVEDQIVFVTNGNQQEVLLLAWGQDAYYHTVGPDSVQVQGLPPFGYVAGGWGPGWVQLCEDVIWQNDKPHVIYGYAVVDSCSSLTIQAGARIHVHSGGGLWIYKYGRLEAIGNLDQPITFQGDRLESFYAEVPGQWDRIWINEGAANFNNVLDHVVIKNSFIGIQCEMLPLVAGQISANTLEMNNMKIRNCSVAGLLSRNYRISSTNLLVGDCGQYGMALTGGGDYSFNHVTIANYWNYSIRQTPAFIMTDRFQDHTGAFSEAQALNSRFVNSIIHGSNTNEFQLEVENNEMQDIEFDRLMVRTDQSTTEASIFPFQERIYRNADPAFENVTDRIFRLTSNSEARNKAIPEPGDIISITDIDDIMRPCEGLPDLGAYEFCP